MILALRQIRIWHWGKKWLSMWQLFPYWNSVLSLLPKVWKVRAWKSQNTPITKSCRAHCQAHLQVLSRPSINGQVPPPRWAWSMHLKSLSVNHLVVQGLKLILAGPRSRKERNEQHSSHYTSLVKQWQTLIRNLLTTNVSINDYTSQLCHCETTTSIIACKDEWIRFAVVGMWSILHVISYQ